MHTVLLRFTDILMPDAAFSNIAINVCIACHDGANKTGSSAYAKMFTKQPAATQHPVFEYTMARDIRLPTIS